MSKVAIVTDSTATIPDDVLKMYPISVVPLQVIWGDDSLRDGIDITNKDFYTRLKSSKTMPSTSQPSPAAFQEVYSKLLDQGYDVLSLHISGKLSGTMDSAIQAKNSLAGRPIEVVDTLSASMGLGFAALQCARAAENGANLNDCRVIAEKAKYHIGALFVVSTLEFLHRGGRIGGAAAFLGTALNLKPVLELQDGRVEAIERVRTFSKAVDRLLDLLADRVGSKTPIRLCSLHANAPEQAAELIERATKQFGNNHVMEALSTEISPVLGTHTGPGTVGIAYMSGM